MSRPPFKLKLEEQAPGKPEGTMKVRRWLVGPNTSYEQFSRMLDEFKNKALEIFQERR